MGKIKYDKILDRVRESDYYDEAIRTIDFAAAEIPPYEGAVTSGTTLSITDTNASWTVDEWKDYIILITHSDTSYFSFAVIESNTVDTLTFDDPLNFTPCDLYVYQIIDTVVIEPAQLPIMVAMDINLNHAGILLPYVTGGIERQYIHAYIEKALNGDYNVPVMCRKEQRQFGIKWGELEHQTEGVKLYAHNWNVPHWDIIDLFNVKRLAAGYFTSPEVITDITWQIIGSDTNLIYDKLKRFRVHPDAGYNWLRYTSLLNRTFIISFKAVIQKTGGTDEEASITIAHRRDGVTEFLTDRVSTTRFNAGDGTQTITVEVPINLEKNDEIIPAIIKEGGTFDLLTGSTIKAIEF